MVDLPSQIVVRQNMKKNFLLLGFKRIATTSKLSSCHEIPGKKLAAGWWKLNVDGSSLGNRYGLVLVEKFQMSTLKGEVADFIRLSQIPWRVCWNT